MTYAPHEPTEQPNWQTKIVCDCGYQGSSWMEFLRHRGDAYRDQLDSADGPLVGR